MKLATVAAALFALFLTLLLVVMALWPSGAHAQVSNCALRPVVMERLADGYGEARVTAALTSTGNLVETWANLQTGTWTVTVTTPGGPTCVVAYGEAFELVVEPAGVEG